MNDDRIAMTERNIERIFGLKCKINDHYPGEHVIHIALPSINVQTVETDGSLVFLKAIESFFKDNIYVQKLIKGPVGENLKMQTEMEGLKKHKTHFDLEKELRGVK